ncbi:unnamed protein product [Trichobilharzia szidati]|nr:unnamed protein product [Trichobilharzia szidati]
MSSANQLPNLFKLALLSCVPLFEIVLVTIILSCSYDFTTSLRSIRWLPYFLIALSALLSLLIVFVRGLQSKFPVNYLILYLNTLLLCFAFIPPMVCVGIVYLLLSDFLSALVLYTSLFLGTLIKKKFFWSWFVYMIVIWVFVSCLISINLYFLASDKVLYHFMGLAFLFPPIPLLLRIGQLLVTQQSERMSTSHFILGLLAISFIFLLLFFSIAIHFYPSKMPSTKP